VIAIYSTFLQRGYDQLIHDVAIQNLDVTFALDRGGLVGNDGATHHGAFDLSYLRCIPNLVVMAASDENECRQMLTTAFRHEGPSAVRYPRGTGPGIAIRQELEGLPIGVGEIKRETQREVARETAEHGRGRIAILAFGSMVTPALAAAEMLEATVANMRFVKPVDAALIGRLAATHDALVTVEENTVMGGAGSAVAEAMAALGLQKPLLMLGLPDHFIDHGDTAKLLASVGLDAAGIERAVRERFADLAGGERRFKSVA